MDFTTPVKKPKKEDFYKGKPRKPQAIEKIANVTGGALKSIAPAFSPSQSPQSYAQTGRASLQQEAAPESEFMKSDTMGLLGGVGQALYNLPGAAADIAQGKGLGEAAGQVGGGAAQALGSAGSIAWRAPGDSANIATGTATNFGSGALAAGGGLLGMIYNTPGALIDSVKGVFTGEQEGLKAFMKSGSDTLGGAAGAVFSPVGGLVQNAPIVKDIAQGTEELGEITKYAAVDKIGDMLGKKFSPQERDELVFKLSEMGKPISAILAMLGGGAISQLGKRSATAAKILNKIDDITDAPIRYSMKATDYIFGAPIKGAANMAGVKFGSSSFKFSDMVRDIAGGRTEVTDSAAIRAVNKTMDTIPGARNAAKYAQTALGASKRGLDRAYEATSKQADAFFKRMFPERLEEEETMRRTADQTKSSNVYEATSREIVATETKKSIELYKGVDTQITTGGKDVGTSIPRGFRVRYDEMLRHASEKLGGIRAFVGETTKFLRENGEPIMDRNLPKNYRDLLGEVREVFSGRPVANQMSRIMGKLDEAIESDTTGMRSYFMELRGRIRADLGETFKRNDQGLFDLFTGLEESRMSVTREVLGDTVSSFSQAVRAGQPAIRAFLEKNSGKFDEEAIRLFRDSLPGDVEATLVGLGDFGKYAVAKLMDSNIQEPSPFSLKSSPENRFAGRLGGKLNELRTKVGNAALYRGEGGTDALTIVTEEAASTGNRRAVDYLLRAVGATKDDFFGPFETTDYRTAGLIQNMKNKFANLTGEQDLPKNLEALPYATIGKEALYQVSHLLRKTGLLGNDIGKEVDAIGPVRVYYETSITDGVDTMFQKDLGISVKELLAGNIKGSMLEGMSKTVVKGLQDATLKLLETDKRSERTKNRLEAGDPRFASDLTIKDIDQIGATIDNLLSNKKLQDSIGDDGAAYNKLQGIITNLHGVLERPMRDDVMFEPLLAMKREYRELKQITRNIGRMLYGARDAYNITGLKLKDGVIEFDDIAPSIRENPDLQVQVGLTLQGVRSSRFSKISESFLSMSKKLHEDPTVVQRGGEAKGRQVVTNPHILVDLVDAASRMEDVYGYKFKLQTLGGKDKAVTYPTQNLGEGGVLNRVLQPAFEEIQSLIFRNKRTSAQHVLENFTNIRAAILKDIDSKKASYNERKKPPVTNDTFPNDRYGKRGSSPIEEEPTL